MSNLPPALDIARGGNLRDMGGGNTFKNQDALSLDRGDKVIAIQSLDDADI